MTDDQRPDDPSSGGSPWWARSPQETWDAEPRQPAPQQSAPQSSAPQPQTTPEAAQQPAARQPASQQQPAGGWPDAAAAAGYGGYDPHGGFDPYGQRASADTEV